ncbi:crotonase/enoyl-CoA hydratase family protein [Notoacmeibacter sp. MSK16QG-6]|uniref:crotonase/enoyl-CoA hydratase family protein n=1 Tax=Notoacmeibacter sp. MSK16QG-6 TaxID=2957982 RepID=UPI00209EA77B|nr:crotonase/enoyl-CoA hydratase family protein [Notoacmeibacter sp. MSK16QG-6]MCP1200289.1 crotonase/enoyl-CoA hydratase family protein [Notoacmeibacter sp. MSK16QG-6]
MKTDFETLAVAVDERGVAALTLNRPERKNALSATMMDELTAFARFAEGDKAIRAVVLSGSEGTFCAGADLSWMMTQIEADRAGRMAEARRLAIMLKALNEMPVPLIGQVEGVAMGGGVGMACICDVAIADEDCRFGFTETRLGIIPATIGPYVLARMGEGRARRVFMNARLFNGVEAAELGIVARAVPAGELSDAIEAEVASYLKLPRGAVGRAKRLARSLGPTIDEKAIEATIEQLADAWEADEAREGISAFLEKRKPVWAQ